MRTFYLISGSKDSQPLNYGPAGQAYPSKATKNLVRLMSAVAPKSWGILTYAQGLVLPSDKILKPQGNIRGVSSDKLTLWSENTYQQIKYEISLKGIKEVVFLCGPYYHSEMAPWIVRDFGIRVLCPFDHTTPEDQEFWVIQQLQRLHEQEQKRLKPCPRNVHTAREDTRERRRIYPDGAPVDYVKPKKEK